MEIVLQQFAVFSWFGHFAKVTRTDYALLSLILLLKMFYFSRNMSLWLKWPCLWVELRFNQVQSCSINFSHVFIIEYIVRSHFVKVL